MRLIRWIVHSGFRVALLVALVVFSYHLVAEIRALGGAPLDFFQRLELTALNVKIRARGDRPPPKWKVAIAVADEKALQRFGRFPWSRTVFADLNDRLTELGAASIAYDVTFGEATEQAGAKAVGAIRAASEARGFFSLADRLETDSKAAGEAASRVGRARDVPLRQLAPQLERLGEDAAAAAQGIRGLDADLAAEADRRDPDDIFADSIRRSGRVVIGVLAHSEVDAKVIDRAQLDHWMKLVASSTLSELIRTDGQGLDYVLDNPAQAFEEGLYRRFFAVAAPVDVIARQTKHFATINAFPDADGVYRRVPLISTIKGTGVAIPTLAVKAIEVAHAPDRIEIIGDEIGPVGVRIGDLFVPTELGASTALSWYGEFDPRRMPIISIADIIDGKTPRSEIEGRVIFVAATAVGTYDQRVTPFGDSVPGVHVHATLAQNILDGRHLRRPQYVIGLELLVFLLIGIIAGATMPKLGVVGQAATALGLAVGWLIFDRYVLFESGLVVYSVLPMLQVFVTLLAVVSWRFLVEERERRKTRQAFGQYLSPAVMEQVLADPEEYLRLGGRRYEATVLFSDIRGFTTISEALSPEDLGTLLNRYMTPMTNIVFEHGGTLDKYIGDAVMAFWGAPIIQSDHALRACRAALEMSERVETLNAEFIAAGLPRIAIGIGLSTGPMTIGNMGSDDHFAYTALGDRVNLGSRLEGQTKDYGVDIIISDACHELVKDQMATRELGALRVKGKLEPVRIFELIQEGPLTGDAAELVAAFHEGLAAFRDRRWDDAIVAFLRALDHASEEGDKCAEDYLELCEEYKRTPPPEGWDGVRVATTK